MRELPNLRRVSIEATNVGGRFEFLALALDALLCPQEWQPWDMPGTAGTLYVPAATLADAGRILRFGIGHAIRGRSVLVVDRENRWHPRARVVREDADGNFWVIDR